LRNRCCTLALAEFFAIFFLFLDSSLTTKQSQKDSSTQ